MRAAGFDLRLGADPPAAELDSIWARWAAAAAERIGPQLGPQIRAAVQTVLADQSYSLAAQRVADEMRETPSVDDLLSELR